MSNNSEDLVTQVAKLCQEARWLLGEEGSMRLRIALEIAEIECAIWAKHVADQKPDNGKPSQL